MRSLVHLAAGLALCLPPFSAEARDTPRDVLKLAPSSQWEMDYADEGCRLSRNFGDRERRVTLVIEQFEPSDDFQLTFIGRSVKPRQREAWVEGELRFGPNEEKIPFTAVLGKVGIENAAFVQGDKRLAPLPPQEKAASDLAAKQDRNFEAKPISADRKKAASWLEISKFLEVDLNLDTGSMERPFLILDHCAWDLVASWGFDVKQQQTLSRKAQPDLKIRWATPDDYPEKMLDRGAQANVRVRLLVDAQGRPTSCTVQKVTKPEEFGEIVCKGAMKKARFTPALDAEGNPVPSYFSRSISFRIAG